MSKRRIKLVIHYDGTAYHGWQAQCDVDTVQAQLEIALIKLCDCEVKLIGSSRTDAGVHAFGQVAHADIDTPVPTKNIIRSLNRYLPDDIVVTDIADVEESFDAIRSTKSKLYRYTLYTAKLRPVRQIRYCWHRPGKLNIKKMQQAAKKLLGKKDFKSFASAADQRESSVRTILKCEVIEEKPFIYIDVEADGFLYNMVRNIVGTLVDIGRGRWDAAYMDEILAAQDRTAAGKIAPARGLCLMEIYY
ncbi:MAG: tRNA pseudouridine(38-40) synthase TruA [Planctomycetes bacterium]|nr:tRNA pseudouridine(38-40) synthase TruA [Planctomycetota bacterium]